MTIKSICVLGGLFLSLSLWGQKEVPTRTVLGFNKTAEYAINISADDAPVAFSFPFQNQSNDTVWITDVVTSCSCTTAQFSKAKVAPHAVSEVTLVYNPYLKSGVLFQQAFVYSNLSGQEEEMVLELNGHVTPTANPFAGFPKQLGELRLKRSSMRFYFERGQKKSTEVLLCINAGKSALALAAATYPFLKFSTEPAIIEPGAEADLLVTIDREEWKKALGEQQEFLLHLQGVGDSVNGLKLEIVYAE